MIRKISGKIHQVPSNTYLKTISRQQPKRHSRSSFFKNSSTNNYSKQYQNIKRNAEKTKLNLKSNNIEDYNQSSSSTELRDSILKSHNKAVGPDEIHYEFLKTTSILFIRFPSPDI